MVVHTKSFCGFLASALGALALVLVLGIASPAAAQTLESTPGRAAVVAPAPENSLRYSSEGLTAFALPGGGMAIDLEGRFKHYLVAHTGPDGKLHVGCTQDPDSVHAHAPTATEVTK
jgi:hypothetical protein